MRFSKLYELFLVEKELLKGKSSGDLRNHQNMGKSFLLPALGTKKVENITLGDWQNIINTAFQKSQAKGHPLSAKSLKNIRASMTAVYAYAKRHNIPLVRISANTQIRAGGTAQNPYSRGYKKSV